MYFNVHVRLSVRVIQLIPTSKFQMYYSLRSFKAERDKLLVLKHKNLNMEIGVHLKNTNKVF